jgi:lipopolysaccharide exporter
VSKPIVERAGSAVAWKAIQLVCIKVIFLGRTTILARLLLPEDFGLLAVSLIAVDFLTSVTELGLVPALVQRRDVDERHYAAAWTMGLIRAAAITAIVFLFAPTVARLLTEPRAVNVIRALAFKPLLVAVANIKTAAMTRDLHFRRLAVISMPDALVNTVVSIGLAHSLGVWGLVAGTLAGQLAYVVMSYWLTPYRPRLLFDFAAVRPLMHFGRWLFLSSVLALAGRSLLQVVISQRLGVAELGLYFLAAKLAFIPAEISSQVVGAVAFPLYAQLQGDVQKAASTFRNIFVGMSALLFPLCALALILAPAVVSSVLGPRWAGTAPLIQLLVLVNVIGLFGDSAVPIFKGMGQPSRLIVVEVLQSSVLVAVIWGLTERIGILNAGYAWLAAVGLSQLVSAHFLRRILPNPFAGLGVPLLAIAAACMVGGLVAWILISQMPDLLGLAIATFISATVIGLLLWVADRRFAFGLAIGLRRAFPQLSLTRGTRPADG